ncbi:hypothetical protein CNR22_08940 [Sphingobacteriaceae bacterium]|nr:hypothetical protein CNR22_08940 [Sphingobacteriaceae bacterium]
MKKFFAFGLIVFCSVFIAGLYGILHDQLTYTISPEYYTKFKFIQFGMYAYGEDYVLSHPRLYVCFVGFLATWWMGPLIGIILAAVGLLQKDARRMLTVTMVSFALVAGIAFFTGINGFIYGKYFLSVSGVNWWLPDILLDKENFIAVGSMHNFSYFGGLLGLFGGVFYSFSQRNTA